MPVRWRAIIEQPDLLVIVRVLPIDDGLDERVDIDGGLANGNWGQKPAAGKPNCRSEKEVPHHRVSIRESERNGTWQAECRQASL
jgi:hypothetical protein